MDNIQAEATSLMELAAKRLGVLIALKPGRRANDVALARVEGNRHNVTQVPFYLLSKLPQLSLDLIALDYRDNTYKLQFALCQPQSSTYPKQLERRRHLSTIQA